VYYNPIHTCITNFNNEINNIDYELKSKEIAIKVGDCLTNLDLSDTKEQLEEFKKTIISILYAPFQEVGEKELGIHNVKRGELFCQKISDSIDEVVISRESDLKSIEELYQILITNYEQWRKIVSRTWLGNIIRGAWEGIKIGVLNGISGFNLGDILDLWNTSNNLSESEFVKLYADSIQTIIETSFRFSQRMDMDFTIIEMLYQEYQEIENSLLHQKIQILLTTGDDIMNIYPIWRETQSNTILKGIPILVQHVFQELQTKKIDEKSLNNIKEMVCAN